MPPKEFVLLFLILLILTFGSMRPALRRHHPRRESRYTTTRNRRKPDRVRHEVIRLKTLSDQSCHKLAATFNRTHGAKRQVTVGKTWVAQVVREHRYEIARLRSRYKRRIPADIAINAVWGLDFTGKADLSGQIHPIAGIIDHGSRLALCMMPTPDKGRLTTLKLLISAIETFGKPRTLKTDNDAAFKSRLLRFALRWLGVRHVRSTPGCPWQNGRIERLFGTLKEKLNQISVANFNELDAALLQFRFWHNHIRPHAHLRGRTPQEAWLGIEPEDLMLKSAHRFSAWGELLEGIYLRR